MVWLPVAPLKLAIEPSALIDAYDCSLEPLVAPL